MIYNIKKSLKQFEKMKNCAIVIAYQLIINSTIQTTWNKKMKRYFAKNVFIENVHDKGNNWTTFEASIGKRLFFCEIKHFEEPSQFGIHNGRISKLRVAEFRYIKGDEITYDRGWCRHFSKAPKEMQAVYRAILKKYN